MTEDCKSADENAKVSEAPGDLMHNDYTVAGGSILYEFENLSFTYYV